MSFEAYVKAVGFEGEDTVSKVESSFFEACSKPLIDANRLARLIFPILFPAAMSIFRPLNMTWPLSPSEPAFLSLQTVL